MPFSNKQYRRVSWWAQTSFAAFGKGVQLICGPPYDKTEHLWHGRTDELHRFNTKSEIGSNFVSLHHGLASIQLGNFYRESCAVNIGGPPMSSTVLPKSAIQVRAHQLTRRHCLLVSSMFQFVYNTTTTVDSQLLLASTSSNVLVGKVCDAAFYEFGVGVTDRILHSLRAFFVILVMLYALGFLAFLYLSFTTTMLFNHCKIRGLMCSVLFLSFDKDFGTNTDRQQSWVSWCCRKWPNFLG